MYKITEICEHNVCLDILPKQAKILDLGARGFQFTDYMRSLGHLVTPVDIDEFKDKVYYRIAITDIDGRVGVERCSDPQATKVKPGIEVESMTLESFSKMVGVEFWDCIKMDIEGSEFNVIMAMTRPMAKQLSIEFHLHTGIYSQMGMKLMEGKLKELGYEFVQHQISERHGAGFSYWDSLFLLKD